MCRHQLGGAHVGALGPAQHPGGGAWPASGPAPDCGGGSHGGSDGARGGRGVGAPHGSYPAAARPGQARWVGGSSRDCMRGAVGVQRGRSLLPVSDRTALPPFHPPSLPPSLPPSPHPPSLPPARPHARTPARPPSHPLQAEGVGGATSCVSTSQTHVRPLTQILRAILPPAGFNPLQGYGVGALMPRVCSALGRLITACHTLYGFTRLTSMVK